VYVIVRLLKGFPQPLIYKMVSSCDVSNNALIGCIVDVPLKKKTLSAVILRTSKHRPDVAYNIKNVIRIHMVPSDTQYHAFIKKVARLYGIQTLHFYQRLRSFIDETKQSIRGDEPSCDGKKKDIHLTEEQRVAVEYIEPLIGEKKYAPILLHGVTGSGKTEIYKKALCVAFQQKKTALFICPEVSLARQFESLLQQQLPHLSGHILGFHSAITVKQKHLVWQRLCNEVPTIIIGVHLPVFLPISNLGLIIIDEEHENGFEEKKHPKVNSKNAALLRAQQYQIPIIMGSATPSITTLYLARQQQWKQFQLTRRFSGAFPRVENVLLSGAHKRKHFWFSNQLLAALKETLHAGKQAIIYLNRRGYSFFAQCKGCGYTFCCENCTVSLTVHMGIEDGREIILLRCHYCDFTKQLASSCPECKASGDTFKQRGIGTQQVVALLQRLFPAACIARADTDISRKKKEWSQTISSFSRQEIDILVGTQIITKGYHFPHVTLVGILWADSSLHFPVYNAHEVALQQIIQVAGRAGRATDNSRVIVQSFTDHEIFNYVNEKHYLAFCERELAVRELTHYPPCGRLLLLELSSQDEAQVIADAHRLASKLEKRKHDSVLLLGPARPIIAKRQRVHSRHIFLKAPTFAPLYKVVEQVELDGFKSGVFITPY